MNKIFAGALAGLTATAPMTVAMLALHRRLPPEDRYALPPREIVESMAESLGVDDEIGEEAETGLAVSSHFAYGATAGALFGPLTPKSQPAALAAGVGYGLAVWAGSYLGWLPAANILEPATNHPKRRTALMIAAHVVWGAALGATACELSHAAGLEQSSADDERNKDVPPERRH